MRVENRRDPRKTIAIADCSYLCTDGLYTSWLSYREKSENYRVLHGRPCCTDFRTEIRIARTSVPNTDFRKEIRTVRTSVRKSVQYRLPYGNRNGLPYGMEVRPIRTSVRKSVDFHTAIHTAWFSVRKSAAQEGSTLLCQSSAHYVLAHAGHTIWQMIVHMIWHMFSLLINSDQCKKCSKEIQASHPLFCLLNVLASCTNRLQRATLRKPCTSKPKQKKHPKKKQYFTLY